MFFIAGFLSRLPRSFLILEEERNIKVFKGDCCRELEIKKRSKGKRTAIHSGWIKFRDDLQLNVGDCCCFKWIDESYQRFRVEVVRAVILLD